MINLIAGFTLLFGSGFAVGYGARTAMSLTRRRKIRKELLEKTLGPRSGGLPASNMHPEPVRG